ncbi:MAG TPA: nucleoside hydrolase [Gaiellaceae bacterium]|nr:nucleoside hydrolase [Gaiellaceae bacterium]
MATRILLDCDPGHDDAIAILLALASPEVELLGITTVHGNQTVEKTTRNTLKVLELVGRGDVPVARGAARPLARELVVADHVHGETGLDGPELPEPAAQELTVDAVSFLAERLAPGVVVVPTGPLTNVARLLSDRPEARPERIVLMGGAMGLGNITPAAEFNIWADPEAAAAVFRSGIDVTMVGLDVTHQAILSQERVARLRRMGRVGRVVAELLDFFTVFHRETYGWEGSPVHDALAVAALIRPELLETVHRHVAVETESELCRGRTVVDLYRRMDAEPMAHVAVGVDTGAFLDLLEERIARLG